MKASFSSWLHSQASNLHRETTYTRLGRDNAGKKQWRAGTGVHDRRKVGSLPHQLGQRKDDIVLLAQTEANAQRTQGERARGEGGGEGGRGGGGA